MNKKTIREIYYAWDLDTGDKDDIMSALEEAYMIGAGDGGMDIKVAKVSKEAIDFFTAE
tara:strand:- start:73512 stop:73688 length:177 start_codon:yes stop_codon:yes gene_type:complete